MIDLNGSDFGRVLFESFPEGVLITDPGGRIQECNTAILEMFGYSNEEMAGLGIKDLVSAETAHTIPEFMDAANTTGRIFVWITCRKQNGTLFPVQYSSRAAIIADKKMILVFIRDVSEHYFCRYPVDSSLSEGINPDARDYPNLSLTWQRTGDTFTLIGFNGKAREQAKEALKEYMGRTAQELYRERQDIISDFEQCFLDRSVLRRKTLYRMFTSGDERIADLTYLFVHPDVVIMHLEDFTERDTAEALSRSFVRSSSIGLCIIQRGGLKFANAKLMEFTGYDEAELSEMDPVSLIFPDDRSMVSGILDHERSLVPGKPIELRIITRAGDIRWMMVTVTSLFYLKHQAFLFNFTDITELKAARNSLDEITTLQSSIMAAIPHAVIGLDNRRIMFTNHAVEAVFGWKPEELIGKTMNVLFPDRESYLREARKLYEQLTNHEAYSLEYAYKRKDGRDVICLTSVSRIGEKEGDRRIVSTYTDITEKRRAEESLRENQRILETLMGNLPGMAYRCRNDWDWSMEFVSEGSYALTGYRPMDLINNSRITYGDLVHPDDRQYVWDKVQDSLKNRERFQITYRIITAEGRVKWVWERGLGILSPAGELIALEGFINDITERKSAEEQLRRSKKQLRIHAEHLHTVLEGERAEIAREIHDELGQILTALKMDLFWVGKRVPEDRGEIQEKVASMINHIDSTIKTVERILMELRPGLLDDLGLTSAIEWQAEEFQRRTGIVCDAILDPDPEKLITDSKISTAVFRICQEALTNIAKHSQATKAEITLKLGRSGIELLVCDNGKGITRSDIKKSGSFGIIGIKERIKLLGGRVAIGGRRDKGTAIRIRISL